MRSVMTHQFSQIPRAEIQRSTFDRSHGYKTTLDSGYLVPILVDEALPGDTFQLDATLFGRFSTPIVPIMDNVFLETFFFAVPMRLVWDNWQRFNGEQDNPGDSTDYVIPQLQAPEGGFGSGSLADYFGVPTGVEGISVSALFFRAYNLIYNEWFRDENLTNRAHFEKTDGPDHPTWYYLRRRTKRRDYFTSCLPWPQKGPGVELPIGNTAPVIFGEDIDPSVVSRNWFTQQTGMRLAKAQTGELATAASGDHVKLAYSTSGGSFTGGAYLQTSDYTGVAYGPVVPNNLWADLSEATAASINTVRQAFQIQRLLERDARGGTRYTELIRAHFGVVSPDARLQRPEFLGGNSSRIYFQPVAQNSATNTVTPQGNLAAFGLVAGNNHGFTKSFTEHCIIIGLVNIRADLTYQQGLPRMFSRKTRFDFYWPSLAHLGEQAVLNKEIYAQGTDDDERVFGYQERYAEYRYFPSQITGKFRSNDPQSLDIWHLSQDFASLPQLNSEFIEDNPPIKRILAVQNEPELLLDCFFNMKCTRPMPLYGVPGLVDHF